MDEKGILNALKEGKISSEDAKKELAKIVAFKHEQFLETSLSKDKTESLESIKENARETVCVEPISQGVVDIHELESDIVIITMQDKLNKNTFSKELITGLINAFEMINSSSKYKAVILTGYGNYFASGGTKEALLSIQEGKSKFTDANIYSLALECKIPVIAAMQGHAIGAGWSMGMFCDFIIMSCESTYTSNYMKYGFTPGAGATLIFPEKFGMGMAQEILLTGNMYQGWQLKERGIHFPIVKRKEVLPYALKIARTLAKAPRESLVILKDHLSESVRKKILPTYKKELEMHDKTFVNNTKVKERIEKLFDQGSSNEKITEVNKKFEQKEYGKRIIKESTISSNDLKKVLDKKDDVQLQQGVGDSIAIIGVSGQFPKAQTLDEFWNNLVQGRECISEVPNSRWDIEKYYDKDTNIQGKTYSKWMGVLDDIDKFDSSFFNISPREAKLMDPQQRVFLQNCWSCIEDAGIRPSSLSGSRCGVFVGCGASDYDKLAGEEGLNSQGFMGKSNAILAARISYMLNLKGPCLAIDTACSSSLVAIAEACNSLILKNSYMALAGGVSAIVGPQLHIMASKAGMLSADGHCYTFDNRANGFVAGEGVGVILLKRLKDAVRDGNQIYGVIRGWATNQDGKTNGITAPCVNSQISVEKEVYERFSINPETISFVETHGTATKLGDPIEIEALTEAFQSFTKKKNYCAIGSVKSNVGHLLAASGVAGVIKVLLSMKHHMLPPNANFESLNQHISLDNSPFYINTKLKPWKVGEGVPRRACVSSFGFSGTNAHIVIEEFCLKDKVDQNEIDISNGVLFLISARTYEQLKNYAERLRKYILTNKKVSLIDIAYTLQVGRDAMEYRLAFVSSSKEALIEALERFIDYDSAKGVLINQVKRKIGLPTMENYQENLKYYICNKNLNKLAELWVKGLNIDWNLLYNLENRPQRVSLPTYPFAKESYWISSAGAKEKLSNENFRDTFKENKKVCLNDKEKVGVGSERQSEKTKNLVILSPLETKSELKSGVSQENISVGTIREELRISLAKVLYMDYNKIDVDKMFMDMGLDSIVGVEWVGQINKKYKTNYMATIVYDYPTIRELAVFLEKQINKGKEVSLKESNKSHLINLAPLSKEQISETHLKKTLNETKAIELLDLDSNSEKLQESQQEIVPKEELIKELKISLAKVLYMDYNKIDVDKMFMDMGLDSIVGVEWVGQINKKYKTNYMATIVYDYPTIRELAVFLEKEINKGSAVFLEENNKSYLVNLAPLSKEEIPETHLNKTSARQGDSKEAEHYQEVSEYEQSTKRQELTNNQKLEEDNLKNLTNTVNEKRDTLSDFKDGIAIVGMSGNYPDSENLDQYWNNLAKGKNSIKEIPKSRWNLDKYYDPHVGKRGKIYCKWLGALDDIDCFDPLFFMISPNEAELMDPQQRIFLQECYKAFEDAGYNNQDLSDKKCGVYLGLMNDEYRTILSENNVDTTSITSNSHAIGASRIAYFLNLKGPAISIDTACSSSLVATHLACKALLDGEIDMALAGGVSLYLTPDTYIAMCAAEMLSKDGKCKAFDNSADGFVPGEGAGVLVLKRLKDAEKDNDHIYGVIIGSGINQDGKTNGITAPSIKSQASLIEEVYNRNKIDLASISYVEMHGTGTKLGDPIELEALSRAIKQKTKKKHFCAIGSVKSNIGHTSAAAGVAGMQKVLLSLKHKKMVPTLNFKNYNVHFNFDESPFYVNTELKNWKSVEGKPRRAGVSAFGFSGTNAHIVIEEYLGKTNIQPKVNYNHKIIFILSAKSNKQLKIYSKRLKCYIESNDDIDLIDMSYTLQVGREPMEHRLAIVVDSKDDLINGLEDFIDDNPSKVVFAYIMKKDNDSSIDFQEDEDAKALLHTWIKKRKLEEVAKAWVKGVKINWNELYPDDIKPYRISLPTYPFAKEHYWVTMNESNAYEKRTLGFDTINPVLHENTSNIEGLQFSSTFTGKEEFIKACTIKGKNVFPSIVYLEMARAAFKIVTKDLDSINKVICMKNVVWSEPIILENEPFKLHIRLYYKTKEIAQFEVYSDNSDEVKIYGQGIVMFDRTEKIDSFNILETQKCCSSRVFSSEKCYQEFKNIGLNYDSGYQTIQKVFLGSRQVLSRVFLPSLEEETHTNLILHPIVLSSILQTVNCLLINSEEFGIVFPIKLESMKILGKCTAKMWIFANYKDERNSDKIDVQLCDDQGKVCVQIKGFSMIRLLPNKNIFPKEYDDELDTLMLYPCWKEKCAIENPYIHEYKQRVVMLCGIDWGINKNIQNEDDVARYLVMNLENGNIAERFQYYTMCVFKEIQSITKSKVENKILIQVVISGDGEQQLLAGMYGLLKSAHAENPNIITQLIEIDRKTCIEDLKKTLKNISENFEDSRIRFLGGKQFVIKWERLEKHSQNNDVNLWRKNGVYLITGGRGSLGLKFAKEIVKKAEDATIILIGRSQLDEKTKCIIKDMRLTGARVEYKIIDVTDRKAVMDLIESICLKFGKLNGIIHCAGIIRDNFIIKKVENEIKEVLAPKVTGLLNLDEASKDVKIDFFILFSSVAGILGNVGQSDYSAANSFMDVYSSYRNELAQKGKRYGHTVSINWPLWESGGMQVDKQIYQTMQNSTGMVPIKDDEGKDAFYGALSSSKNQIAVLKGYVNKMKKFLG